MARILLVTAVYISIVSFRTQSIAYGDFQDQMRNYYDTVYQRSSQLNSEESRDIELKMPGVHPKKHDSYLCTAVDLRQKKQYIVGFKPSAEMHTAHHMLMFGCAVPAEMALATDQKYWNCGDMGKGICGRQGEGEKILYAWGRNAPELKLPKDVAFEVGGDSGISYLVLQVHYGKVDQFDANPSLKDYSGVNLKTTFVQPKNLAAILLLAAGGVIPKKETAWHLNMGCRYENGAVLHPFAFRVHAHTLGTVITGYRVRNNKWTLIGKGDPQRPQAFYPIDAGKDVSIQSGDVLAGRCTYNSMKRDRITYIGATMADEMCNFYMMYWFNPQQSDMGTGIPESACGFLDERALDFPYDSDVPLPGSGPKMEMKRDFVEGCKPYCNGRETSLLLKEDEQWAGNNPRDTKLGQVTAVDTDADGNVVIFHRASRRWEADSFDNQNIFTRQREPIPEATVLKLDPHTGKLVGTGWGQNMFFMPHGLTIDHEGNTWLTDVALHQVFKFPPGENQPSLTLGVRFKPGNDLDHFCKPTDVAVDSSGFFYVADGYCNSRVMKFSPDGSHKMEFISNSQLQGIVPGVFQIPHSLSLDERDGRLFVADRENGRVLVFKTGERKLLREIKEFGKRVFAVHYHPEQGGVLHVVNGPMSLNSRAKGFTFSLKNDTVVQDWRPALGFTEPHDVTSDSQGGAVYVTDIGSNTVWKFKRLG